MYQFYFFILAFIIVLNKNITSPILVEPLNACSVNAYIFAFCLLFLLSIYFMPVSFGERIIVLSSKIC